MSKLILQFRKNKYKKMYNNLKNCFIKSFFLNKKKFFKSETIIPITEDKSFLNM